MKPLISVIIPAYNCEKTIAIAIKSILDQTYPNIEIVVVDDKSTDKTKEIVQNIISKNPTVKLVDGHDDPYRFDVKLNRNVNAGWSARNTGFEYTKGELITFQDADDASLLNRIEIQYKLLKKYNSTHLCIDWIKFNEKYLGKKLDISHYLKDDVMIGPEELCRLAKRSKGLVAKISTTLNELIPFNIKRIRGINKIFFGSLENYPGPGNSPLFKREVIEKVTFRPLSKRMWPSFMGRGADRDFNFQVAETFKNSHVCFVPLYLWRVKTENLRHEAGIDKFLQ